MPSGDQYIPNTNTTVSMSVPNVPQIPFPVRDPSATPFYSPPFTPLMPAAVVDEEKARLKIMLTLAVDVMSQQRERNDCECKVEIRLDPDNSVRRSFVIRCRPCIAWEVEMSNIRNAAMLTDEEAAWAADKGYHPDTLRNAAAVERRRALAWTQARAELLARLQMLTREETRCR